MLMTVCFHFVHIVADLIRYGKQKINVRETIFSNNPDRILSIVFVGRFPKAIEETAVQIYGDLSTTM